MTRPHGLAATSRDTAGSDGDEEFYQRYIAPIETRMLHTIWRVVHDKDMAHDALQDALVVTWRRRERVRAHPNPEALVLRICINAAIDALRRSQRHRAPVELPASVAAGPTSGPVASLEARELREHVLDAIGHLPPKQASAVLMRVVEERPYRVIAEALECAEATARIHVMRGRARLGRLLAHLAPVSRRSGGRE